MITSEFKQYYQKLNSSQKEAVDQTEGPVMVVAGPGTGKTQILTLRIANILLKTDTEASSILVLTFSEAAALQIRSRLTSLIGTPAYKVEISTFHGFCNNVIRNNPEEFPHLISSEAITEVEQIEIIEKIILENSFKYLKPFGDPLYYLRSSLSGINDLKKENIKPDDFKEALENQKLDFEKIEDLYHEKGKYKQSLPSAEGKNLMKGKYQDLQKEIAKNSELLFIYEEYQKQLLKQKKYDFNDMLLEVVNAFKVNKGLLLRLQERYQYILVDEHQDTNAAQNKIVEFLADFYENPNLFVVGDEKQAIYRFQGASLENFLYFQKLYPGVKLINLTDNYRSHQIILDAAGSVIKNNLTANLLLPNQGRLMARTGVAEVKIKLVVLKDYHSEFQYLAEEIDKLKKSGANLSEIAILGRNNKDLISVGEFLERLGIPFSIHTDQNVFADLEIQKLLSIFRALNNFGSDLELIKVMHVSLFSLEPLDVYKLISQSPRERESVHELLEKVATDEELKKKLKLQGREKVVQFYNQLKSWWTDSNNLSLEHLFVKVVKESGFQESILKSPKRYEILDKVIALFEQAKVLSQKNPQFNLKDFVNYLDLLEKHNLSLKTQVRTQRINAVRLMTAHRSKGLEYDYVFIINTYDGHWGNSRARSNSLKLPWTYLTGKLDLKDIEDVDEDERRLFFVAMTRARKMIYLTYSGFSIDGKEQLPSRFISEIEPDLMEQVETEEFEKRFSENKQLLFEGVDQKILKTDEREFVRQLFLEKGLSVSGLDNFLQCPWKFFYRNLLLLPEIKSNAMVFGIAIHFALDSYIRSVIKKPLTLKEFGNKFDEALKKEGLYEKDYQALLEKGLVVLENYYKAVIPDWKNKKIESEVNIRGVKLTENITLNGRLDMIEATSSKDQFIVHDFKTGKPKSRKSIDGSSDKSPFNYLGQLVFYKILMDNYQGGRKKMVSGVIDFVESTQSGTFKSEFFDITEEQVRELEDQIKIVGKQIFDLSFWDTRCEDKDCVYCKLREITK